MRASNSPRLIAGNHVLHRLCVPRYPPWALCSLTKLTSTTLRVVEYVFSLIHLTLISNFRFPFRLSSKSVWINNLTLDVSTTTKERYRVSALDSRIKHYSRSSTSALYFRRLLLLDHKNNASMRCFIFSRLTYAVVKVLLNISVILANHSEPSILSTSPKSSLSLEW